MTNKWNLREIVLMAILSVVFAVIYLMFFTVGTGLVNILTPFGLGPFGYEIIFGVWFIVSIITAYSGRSVARQIQQVRRRRQENPAHRPSHTRQNTRHQTTGEQHRRSA